MVDDADVHCMMVGAAGCGKTAYWLYPNLEYACASGMSFLTTDTKGDLYRNYGGVARDCYGYNVAVIDLRNPTKSDGNNLLHLVNKYMDLHKAAPGDVAYKAKSEKYAKIISKTLIYGDGDASAYLNGEISDVTVDPDIIERVRLLYDSVGSKIEKGAFREALEDIFEGVRFGNTYYDAKQPWKTRVDNIDECKETIAVCTYLIANIANLLHPFLPFSSQKVSDWLGTTLQWKEQVVSVKDIPSDISILFSKIE